MDQKNRWSRDSYAQHPGEQQVAGVFARTKALTTFPSIWGAMAAAAIPSLLEGAGVVEIVDASCFNLDGFKSGSAEFGGVLLIGKLGRDGRRVNSFGGRNSSHFG